MEKIYHLVLLVFLLMLTGCGSGQGKGELEHTKNTEQLTATSQTEKMLEVTDSNGNTITFDRLPQSFAALSSGDLDILEQLEANIVGRPTSRAPVSDQLKEVKQIGNAHQLNFEQIAAVNPDVLLASPSVKAHTPTIEKQGTKVVYTKANSVQDIQQTIALVGQLLDKEEKAKALIQTIDEKIKQEQSTIKQKGTKTLLVYGAPGTYLAALPHSLPGNLLELAGGENIAKDFPKEDEFPQYASLSVEKIIERNPELVLLITHGEPNSVKKAFEEEMLKNPAWKNLDAVKENRVIVLPSDLFGTNPGTKVVDAFAVMKESLQVGTK